MNVTLHDFTRPVPLTAAWEERLNGWTRAATVLANKTWAKQLPIPLQISVAPLNLWYAEQAVGRLPEPCLAYRVKVAESHVPTLLALPPRLMLNLVGVLLGEDAPADSDRDLTLIEENLGDYFLTDYWLSAFRATWPGPKSATWILDGREANPRAGRASSPGDALIAFDWQITGPWGEAGGVWLIPKPELLQALGDSESAGKPAISETLAAARRQTLVQALPLPVQVVLGTAELSLAQLAQLQVGDLLMLDPPGVDTAVARVGGRDFFRGKVGRQGSSKAIQIQSLIEK
jgi:flagellar motor switch protein FliM